MMLKKKLMLLVIVITISINAIATTATTTTANKPSCEETLLDCANYVSAFEDERRIYRNVIKRQETMITDLQGRPEPISWYWYFIGGAAMGVVTYKFTR